MNSPEITIGYSTTDLRIDGLSIPSPVDGVEILIVVQGDRFEQVVRSDVRYITLHNTGVAKSRNVVLREAAGRFLLFGDDDIIWDLDGLRRGVEFLKTHPATSLILLQATNPDGILRKNYPTTQTALSRWNSAKAATYEIMVRREDFQQAGVCFDENFGAGAHNHLGDEYILIVDALRSGLDCKFVPFTIATHPEESSGLRFDGSHDAISRSAVFSRVFGFWSAPVKLAFLLRSPTRFGSASASFRFLVNRSGHNGQLKKSSNP